MSDLDAPSVGAAGAGGIDRDALLWLGYEYLDPYGIDGQPTEHARRVVSEFADRILALVRPAPPALDLAVVRRVLLDSLPDDPKWVVWVDGVMERLDASSAPAARAGGIDREKARDVLDSHVDRYWHGDQDDVLDALEGCVQPVPPALTSDDWALIVDCLRDIPDSDLRMAQVRPSRQEEIDERRALADRIERRTDE